MINYKQKKLFRIIAFTLLLIFSSQQLGLAKVTDLRDARPSGSDYLLAMVTGYFQAQAINPSWSVQKMFVRTYLVPKAADWISKDVLGIKNLYLRMATTAFISAGVNGYLDAKEAAEQNVEKAAEVVNEAEAAEKEAAAKLEKATGELTSGQEAPIFSVENMEAGASNYDEAVNKYMEAVVKGNPSEINYWQARMDYEAAQLQASAAQAQLKAAQANAKSEVYTRAAVVLGIQTAAMAALSRNWSQGVRYLAMIYAGQALKGGLEAVLGVKWSASSPQATSAKRADFFEGLTAALKDPLFLKQLYAEGGRVIVEELGKRAGINEEYLTAVGSAVSRMMLHQQNKYIKEYKDKKDLNLEAEYRRVKNETSGQERKERLAALGLLIEKQGFLEKKSDYEKQLVSATGDEKNKIQARANACEAIVKGIDSRIKDMTLTKEQAFQEGLKVGAISVAVQRLSLSTKSPVHGAVFNLGLSAAVKAYLIKDKYVFNIDWPTGVYRAEDLNDDMIDSIVQGKKDFSSFMFTMGALAATSTVLAKQKGVAMALPLLAFAVVSGNKGQGSLPVAIIGASVTEAQADVFSFGRARAKQVTGKDGRPEYDFDWVSGNDTFFAVRYANYINDVRKNGLYEAMMDQFMSAYHYQAVNNYSQIMQGKIDQPYVKSLRLPSGKELAEARALLEAKTNMMYYPGGARWQILEASYNDQDLANKNNSYIQDQYQGQVQVRAGEYVAQQFSQNQGKINDEINRETVTLKDDKEIQAKRKEMEDKYRARYYQEAREKIGQEKLVRLDRLRNLTGFSPVYMDRWEKPREEPVVTKPSVAATPPITPPSGLANSVSVAAPIATPPQVPKVEYNFQHIDIKGNWIGPPRKVLMDLDTKTGEVYAFVDGEWQKEREGPLTFDSKTGYHYLTDERTGEKVRVETPIPRFQEAIRKLSLGKPLQSDTVQMMRSNPEAIYSLLDTYPDEVRTKAEGELTKLGIPRDYIVERMSEAARKLATGEKFTDPKTEAFIREHPDVFQEVSNLALPQKPIQKRPPTTVTPAQPKPSQKIPVMPSKPKIEAPSRPQEIKPEIPPPVSVVTGGQEVFLKTSGSDNQGRYYIYQNRNGEKFIARQPTIDGGLKYIHPVKTPQPAVPKTPAAPKIEQKRPLTTVTPTQPAIKTKPSVQPQVTPQVPKQHKTPDQPWRDIWRTDNQGRHYHIINNKVFDQTGKLVGDVSKGFQPWVKAPSVPQQPIQPKVARPDKPIVPKQSVKPEPAIKWQVRRGSDDKWYNVKYIDGNKVATFLITPEKYSKFGIKPQQAIKPTPTQPAIKTKPSVQPQVTPQVPKQHKTPDQPWRDIWRTDNQGRHYHIINNKVFDQTGKLVGDVSKGFQPWVKAPSVPQQPIQQPDPRFVSPLQLSANPNRNDKIVTTAVHNDPEANKAVKNLGPGKKIVLIFDDGAAYEPIRKFLAKNPTSKIGWSIPGKWLEVPANAKKTRELLARYPGRITLINHTYSHPDKNTAREMGVEEARRDIRRAQDAFRKAGLPLPTSVRGPGNEGQEEYGAFADAAQHEGLVFIGVPGGRTKTPTVGRPGVPQIQFYSPDGNLIVVNRLSDARIQKVTYPPVNGTGVISNVVIGPTDPRYEALNKKLTETRLTDVIFHLPNGNSCWLRRQKDGSIRRVEIPPGSGSSPLTTKIIDKKDPEYNKLNNLLTSAAPHPQKYPMSKIGQPEGYYGPVEPIRFPNSQTNVTVTPESILSNFVGRADHVSPDTITIALLVGAETRSTSYGITHIIPVNGRKAPYDDYETTVKINGGTKKVRLRVFYDENAFFSKYGMGSHEIAIYSGHTGLGERGYNNFRPSRITVDNNYSVRQGGSKQELTLRKDVADHYNEYGVIDNKDVIGRNGNTVVVKSDPGLIVRASVYNGRQLLIWESCTSDTYLIPALVEKRKGKETLTLGSRQVVSLDLTGTILRILFNGANGTGFVSQINRAASKSNNGAKNIYKYREFKVK